MSCINKKHNYDRDCIWKEIIEYRFFNNDGLATWISLKKDLGCFWVRWGNQNNSVCYAIFGPSDLEYYWYGKTNRPSDVRYDLPLIKSVSGGRGNES